ncbi:uncharacterized protein G2W53_006644 [Senna tora]|uniref:Retrotransposon gag domain-containing protein n=1 Tax=Senna tora TaxID=362788 RepID=A0A834X4C5_9FABA|nr:uncharacterized protein G2W53_006644 [Senna tora]
MGSRRAEEGAAEEPVVDRTTALLAALTARRTAQEKARGAAAGSTPEQGSVNLPLDPRDDAMIALLEQQKLLKEELDRMRQKMGDKDGQEDNSKRQGSHRTSHRSRSRKKGGSKRRRGDRESDRGSSGSRSRNSSSSSDSTGYTPPKKNKKKKYPFVDSIMEVAMPKLRTPTQLKHYDGMADPVAHVNSFKAAMLYAGDPDEVMCRAFPSTLDGDAQLWFSDLPSRSISSFKQLSKRFTSYFATSRTIKRTAHCLKNVVQGKDESLKDFLIRFTKEGRQIQGLKMEPPRTMAEMLSRCTKYIAFEEVEQAKGGGSPAKELAEPSRSRSEGYRREDRRDERSRRDRRQKVPYSVPRDEGKTEGSTSIMSSELADPRKKEEERRPNPEGEMETVDLWVEKPYLVKAVVPSPLHSPGTVLRKGPHVLFLLLQGFLQQRIITQQLYWHALEPEPPHSGPRNAPLAPATPSEHFPIEPSTVAHQNGEKPPQAEAVPTLSPPQGGPFPSGCFLRTASPSLG